ncbi:head-tail connector protein [Agrobacterium pusense]|uniref:head-tail connector protein n=1 Tax=Agrobacterium pusense TaxID=648995 RepID=UPI000513A706|nr:head-tail connector protein [Agrobacterium pusense]ANV22848.1 DNA-packaging protein [Rhizobium sp. S41]KGE79992.1 DNA-packaging protein [Rhizobium sp. H41]QWW75109.1 head-tail connector protein [Agrobacterium pusense]
MIVTTEQMKAQLNILSSEDDEIIGRKIEAAQNHIERLLGFKIEETYGGTDQEEIPPALIEAVCQLAAHWFENREAALVGVSGEDLPFGLWQIVNEYREYSFG